MDALPTLLWRNQGQILSPELIAGILYNSGPDAVSAAFPVRRASCDVLGASNRLVIDAHERVAAWVAERAGCNDPAWFGYVGIGIERAGELVGGAVLEGFTVNNANIHVAGTGRYWLNRTFLYTVFEYAFNELKLKRLTGFVPASNHDAIRFDTHLGFEHEATLRDAADDGDLLVFVLRPENCRFLRRS